MIFKLYLGNNLGDEGAEALAEVLPEMPSLTTLDLGSKLL